MMSCKIGFGQTSIDDLNHQLRDIFINLKKAPGHTPFLYDMSSHILSDQYYISKNDTSIMSDGIYYTMYEEMRSSAYDTTVLKPIDNIVKPFKKAAKKDTVLLSILNADYAVFSDSAFANEGQYYYTTDTSVTDVPNRITEPFNIRNVFVSSINTPISYYKKVLYVLDTNYIFANNKLLSDYSQNDLNPNFARWKVDFGDGAGWREFDPKKRNEYVVLYKDTGLYFISTAIFYCDPFPRCDLTPSKLSKTSIYILTNKTPTEPDYIYEFTNISVGLYKGCGEVIGGVYIPNKPLIIVEGIDIINSNTIPKIYEDYVLGTDKRLSELISTGYDFYIVNFNDSKIDLRQNARGVIELLDYLKSIMTTNEQFVVIGESMGGVIARYALTYMETELYKNEPNVSKPNQLHNTRLLITNDSPHQGAYVPIAYQMLYRNIVNSLMYKVMSKAKYMFPVIDDIDEMSKLMDAKAIQQLLIYHLDANGPHPERATFMNEIITLNPQTNGYPQYCKLMAMTDGLLTGQHQLKTDSSILVAGERIFNFHFKSKIILYRFIKIDFIDYNLDLFSVDKAKPNKDLYQASNTYFTITVKGCLRHLLKFRLVRFVDCAVHNLLGSPLNVASNAVDNYETVPGGIFPSFSLIKDQLNSKHLDLLAWDLKYNFVRANGNINFTFTTSKWNILHYYCTPEIEINLGLPYLDFGFIPVQSAIDLDYHKTQSFAADFNLLNGDVQKTIFQYTPFHIISGFENFNSKYPKNLDAGLGNRNWSHGYFTNVEIENVHKHGYISREIGDDFIYLNNLDLGERDADFTFKDVKLGINNPHYKYQYVASLDIYGIEDGTYSKQNPFHFKEPGNVDINYEDNFVQGNNIIIEGILAISKTTIKNCQPLRPIGRNGRITDSLELTSKITSEIIISPNPFLNEIVISGMTLSKKYSITVTNILGQIEMETIIENNSSQNIKLDLGILENNSLYIITIISNDNQQLRQRIVKL